MDLINLVDIDLVDLADLADLRELADPAGQGSWQAEPVNRKPTYYSHSRSVDP